MTDFARFRDRHHAGQFLAEKLARFKGREDTTLVLALPRGGVPVAYPVARTLDAPLDVFVVRKLGVPWHEELAMGAVARGGVRVVNRDVIDSLRITPEAIDDVARRETIEVARREREYRGRRPYPRIEGQTVLIIDDGLATGASMRAAALALRQMQPEKLVVAVPVGAAETCDEIRESADEVVCGFAPHGFMAVGQFYEQFGQTTDDEVRELLERAAEERRKRAPLRHPQST
jgi:putative phosphoribosyl transferase